MPQKPLYMIVAVAVVLILFALILLPIIAGLLEGDFGYVRWVLDRGWNRINDGTPTQAITDVYTWSLWRISLCEKPWTYLRYSLIQSYKSL